MAECFQDFILRVPVQDLVRHHFQELLVLNSAASVVINVRYHLLNLLLLRLKAERAHRNFKLLGIDGARPVGAKRSNASLISCFCSSVSSFCFLPPALKRRSAMLPRRERQRRAWAQCQSKMLET